MKDYPLTQLGNEMSHHESDHMSGEWICTTPGTVVSSSSGVPFTTLFQALDFFCLCGNPATCLIQTVTVDSRNSGTGALFLALCGAERDGHDFVDQALESNCAAIVIEKGCLSEKKYKESKACIVEVDDTRKAYSGIAEVLYSHPSSNMTMFAVTGTNGKTSISYLLESVLRHAGKQVGVIGTINYRYYTKCGELKIIPSSFTTPEPFLLQESLRKMADAGVGSVIMEVSSHGLEQNRIGQLLFDVAAFTNLSRDHLDYHQDMDLYFQAKTLLFTDHLQNDGKAVIGFSDETSEWSKRLLDICKDQSVSIISCGIPGCEMYPLSVSATLKKTEISLQTKEGIYELSSPLVGDFNVENLQICFAMAHAAGISSSIICDALQSATGAPGRMQRITGCGGEEDFRPTVFVDYAHTPDALNQVLRTVKELPHTRLFCVFGCGGDRDSGKRPLMGEICGRYADIAIITDDNPRTENPVAIREMIAEGVQKTELSLRDIDWLKTGAENGCGYVMISDRHKAISAAIGAGDIGDIVLIAGKGHEDYQITRDGKRFFDDTLEAKNGLSEWTLPSLVLASRGKCVESENGAKLLGAVSTDSRKIHQNDIFVALKGERFDAHDYLDDAASAGAGCILVERKPKRPLSGPYILVSDSLKALGDLATYRRACMKKISAPQVVGITGSSGKTTVKEMCFSIFQQQWPDRQDKPKSRVLKTKGNYNNCIGLPLSLLPISPKHEGVILEMGMNRPGEIERLTEIADPDIACILNVHGAHLQGLGSIEGVAAAKGELFGTCGKDTVLIINNDDFRVVALADKCKQKKIYFGLDESHSLDIYISSQDLSEDEKISFTLHIGEKQTQVELQVIGLHNISNALAAAGIAHGAGIDILTIGRGLSTFRATDRRMEILDGPAGSRIINDTYNANPASMKAGLKTLAELGDVPRIAVLGDMLELGPGSGKLHKEIGRYAGDSGIEFLGVLGDYAEFVAQGVAEADNVTTVVKVFSSQEQCYDWLQELLREKRIQTDSYILVKGSRGMHLESLVEQLVAVINSEGLN